MQDMIFAATVSKAGVAMRTDRAGSDLPDQPDGAFAKLVSSQNARPVEINFAENAAPDDFVFAPGMPISVPLDAPIELPQDADEFSFGTTKEKKLAEVVGPSQADSQPQTKFPELDAKLEELGKSIADQEDIMEADSASMASNDLSVVDMADLVPEGSKSTSSSIASLPEPEAAPPVEQSDALVIQPNNEGPTSTTDRPISEPREVIVKPLSAQQHNAVLIEAPSFAGAKIPARPIENIFLDDDASDTGPEAAADELLLNTPKDLVGLRKSADMQPQIALRSAASQLIDTIKQDASPAETMSVDGLTAREGGEVQMRSSGGTIALTSPPPPTAQAIATQISAAISQTSASDIEIRLDPEELGKLRITLTPKEGGYDVLIMADREQTLDLMKRNAAALSDQFRQMGYDGSTLSFEQSAEQDQPQRKIEDEKTMATIIVPPFGPRMTSPTDGLDIRY